MVLAVHHQAPYRLGAGLTVAGWSPDGEVTEALEVNGHRFGVGVHWHPEESDDLRLFTALVEAAAEPRTAPAARTEAAAAAQAGRDQAQGRRPPVDPRWRKARYGLNEPPTAAGCTC